MLTNVILTIISQDKPGIIESIARIVAEHEGNWLESRLTQLAGKFAGVVRLQIDQSQQIALTQALHALRAQHITVLVDEGEETQSKDVVQLASFHAVGADRPGIVREISQAFAYYKINVKELNTQYTSMPYSGEPLFEAEGKLQIPEKFPLYELEEKLDQIANHLAVDISIKLLD